MSYGDYVEQLTYLLFLKMADERSRPPYHQPSPIPAAYAWPALLAKDGDALFDHGRHTLEELGKQPGTLALIFGKAQNKFQDPAKLRRVIVDLISDEAWSAMVAGAKVVACEGLAARCSGSARRSRAASPTRLALVRARRKGRVAGGP
jgi:type I restriction enzyme M protein